MTKPYTPHKNESTPPLHEFYVPGIIDEQGPAYVYCMTSGRPTVDSFIRDLSNTVRYDTPAEFEQSKRAYPGLRGLKLFKVAVIEEVK
jgi:hypothetical protein